jgi:hypothetical protein
MDDAIKQIQSFLDKTARDCLRLMTMRTLKPNQYQRLAKFVFGCMNQKQTLPDRVKQRGLVELDKVLKFASKAAEVLIEIDADNQTS